MSISDVLFSSPCKESGLCRDPFCETAVAEYTGKNRHDNTELKRWFITFGHAGFNSPTNNGSGYGSKKSALSAMRRYLGKNAIV